MEDHDVVLSVRLRREVGHRVEAPAHDARPVVGVPSLLRRVEAPKVQLLAALPDVGFPASRPLVARHPAVRAVLREGPAPGLPPLGRSSQTFLLRLLGPLGRDFAPRLLRRPRLLLGSPGTDFPPRTLLRLGRRPLAPPQRRRRRPCRRRGRARLAPRRPALVGRAPQPARQGRQREPGPQRAELAQDASCGALCPGGGGAREPGRGRRRRRRQPWQPWRPRRRWRPPPRRKHQHRHQGRVRGL